VFCLQAATAQRNHRSIINSSIQRQQDVTGPRHALQGDAAPHSNREGGAVKVAPVHAEL
jgi:hypothetical protein